MSRQPFELCNYNGEVLSTVNIYCAFTKKFTLLPAKLNLLVSVHSYTIVIIVSPAHQLYIAVAALA